MFGGRKQFTYQQQVQKSNGSVITENVSCYWSPDSERINTYIADTAAVQIAKRSKGDAVAIGEAKLI